MLKLLDSTSLSQVSQQMADQGLEVALVVSSQDYPRGIISLKLLNQLIAAELKLEGDLSGLLARSLAEILPKLEPIQATIAPEPLLAHATEHLLILDQAGKPQQLLDSKQLYQKLKLSCQKNSDHYNQISKEAARLKLCTEMNQVGCWQLNLLTMTTEWNQILFEILGLSPTLAASYSTWNDLIHPEDRDFVIAEFDQAIQTHQELEVRHRIIQPGGKELWLLTRGMTLYNDQDQPLAMVGICVDITDAHRIRLALERKRQDYQSLIRQITEKNQAWQETLNSITEGFVSIDHNWQVIQANSTASELIGFKPSELVGSNFWDIFSQCYDNQFGAIYRKAMETKEYQEIRDFHPVLQTYLQVRVFPSNLGISLFVKDISDSHQLKLERDRLLTHSPWITLIADNQGQLRQLNPAWESVLGFTVVESLDRPFMDFLHPDDLERTIAHMQVMISSNQPTSEYEVRYITKSGRVKWLSWDCIPFFGENKIYGFGRDVTMRKQVEDEILQLNQSLGQRVAERTLELERREDYLKAIIKLQNLFIAQPFDQAMGEALKILGEVTGSSRAFLFKNDFSQGFSTSQIAEWCAPGIISQLLNQELQNITKDKFPTSWLQTVACGHYFYAKTEEMNEPQRSRLASQQIHSILEFPIQVQDQWWGFFGFDQCDGVKTWTESELTLLKAVALTIGLAIERQASEDSLLETTKKLNESIQFANSIAAATPSLIYIFDLVKYADTYTNRPTHVELGYELGEDTINCLDQIHPEDSERLNSYLQTLAQAESNRIHQIEYRIRTKDNQWRWYFSQDQVFKRDPEGKVIEIIGAITNISDRKLIEQQLERTILEKETLLQELNHRVKNNLNLIISLVVLKSQRITDPSAKQLFKDLQDQILAIADVHHQLCCFDQTGSIDLSAYIRSLIKYFERLYTDRLVQIEAQTEQITVSISAAIYFGLIINELVTNAIKYAFPNRTDGKIIIQLTQTQDSILLSVSDNGVGCMKLVDPPESRVSLGLGIVELLVKGLKGKSSFANRDQGIEARIQVPHSR